MHDSNSSPSSCKCAECVERREAVSRTIAMQMEKAQKAIDEVTRNASPDFKYLNKLNTLAVTIIREFEYPKEDELIFIFKEVSNRVEALYSVSFPED